ncbi:YfgM family protein [Pseudoxanthomonas suwonensis]|jgi:Uncharacterized protein conserved in bacteria|uniref:YfgM family protein n=1 Tax=Pseudoxanthomonas suwonensis TaxID=314722 RepID=UPI00138F0356|nr:tetratricopeptide repeat protein [Pseudoxanthomonas suwonensis]KAF1699734.1 hypothetical protein CSC68_14195 [Pseudoxanthomonas suwonensis]
MALDDLLDEHEQGERVRAWLRRNLPGIIAGLALGVGAIYGMQKWQEHRHGRQQAAHAAYATAIARLEAGAEDPGAALSGQEGVYATLGALHVAKAQVEAGKPEDAIATLRGIKADPALEPVVQQRLAQLLVATGKAQEAIDLLDGQSDTAALELRGDAFMATGKQEQARAEYDRALAALDVQAPARRRVELKLQEAGGDLPEPAGSI